jgi:hypothetical protein
MPVTVEVKALRDAATKAARELTAQRVLREFAAELPDLRLLAFLDDEDPDQLRRELGPANRGFYGPIKAEREWPARMAAMIFVFVDEIPRWRTSRVFDHGIYLYGSTCSDETALTMTFAHELQHFVQYGSKRKLWAVGRLIRRVPEVIDALGLRWQDIPHEREARIAAKRVGLRLCGADAVKRYIDRRITENVTAEDVEDWRFSRDLDPLVDYNLPSETRLIFQRLKPYRQTLEDALQEMKTKRSPDFRDEYKDIDLAAYFDDA